MFGSHLVMAGVKRGDRFLTWIFGRIVELLVSREMWEREISPFLAVAG